MELEPRIIGSLVFNQKGGPPKLPALIAAFRVLDSAFFYLKSTSRNLFGQTSSMIAISAASPLRGPSFNTLV